MIPKIPVQSISIRCIIKYLTQPLVIFNFYWYFRLVIYISCTNSILTQSVEVNLRLYTFKINLLFIFSGTLHFLVLFECFYILVFRKKKTQWVWWIWYIFSPHSVDKSTMKATEGVICMQINSKLNKWLLSLSHESMFVQPKSTYFQFYLFKKLR